MPGYIERVLKRFAHPLPSRPEDAPHQWTRPDYGAKVQFATNIDASPPLEPAGTKRVQEVVGTLLFYARAVDGTMLPALGMIASQQSTATHKTMSAVVRLLNYAATHPDASILYHASAMVLHVDSDASYLSETKAWSPVAGYHYLSNTPPNKPLPHQPLPPLNGSILILCQILREVVVSAAEAELAGCFHNGKDATAL
jgi:hypothetical protein